MTGSKETPNKETEDERYEEVKLKVGEKLFDSQTGWPKETNYRTVTFQARKLEEKTWSRSRKESGTDKTLYRLAPSELEGRKAEGPYLVFAVSESRWVGTRTTKELKGPYSASELSEEYPNLARKARIEVPADLEEVL